MPEWALPSIVIEGKTTESINIRLLHATILGRVESGINTAAGNALAQAEIDVPVRKVFKYTRKNVHSKLFAEQRIMGRQETRTLSLEEALSESLMRRKLGLPSAFPTNAAGRRRLGEKATVQTAQFGRLGAVGSYRSRSRTNLSPDDAHTRDVRRISGVNRLVTQQEREDKLGDMFIPHRASESDLSARGRYELKRADQSLGGALKKSLKLHPATISRGGRVKASISAGGGDVDYAKYVEFGTRRSRAQPFLRPALAKVRTELPTIMKTALQGGVQR
jgi:HK97 gp10 family phage protein